jgi:sugar lactone lactonase YvrE
MRAPQEIHLLADGFAFVESPRWHDGRLWFAHWGPGELVAVRLDGSHEVVGRGAAGLGWSFDWLPTGQLLLTGDSLRRQHPDGSLVEHTDLRGFSDDWNEIVVDGRGNIYVNGGCDFAGDPDDPPGVVALVSSSGSVEQVVDGLAFPNGMAVTPDNATLLVAESFASRLTAFDIDASGRLSNRRVWADVDGFPDGICLDAEGAVWFADVPNQRCVRVREGGEVLSTVTVDRGCFACLLGGPDRRTLFLLTAQWSGPDGVDEQLARRTGQIAVMQVDVPGVGWP